MGGQLTAGAGPMAIDLQALLLRWGRVMADRQFTRANDANWIFRGPTPWFVGPRPHYRVDETQKAKIEMVYGGTGLAGWLLFAIGLVLWVWGLSLLFIVLWIVVLAALENSVRWLALRPLLQDTPRTN
jgi:hypothetical protein